MFGFLNRNKTPTTITVEAKPVERVNGQANEQTTPLVEQKSNQQLIEYIEDAKKNLYEAIIHKRTDIVVTILNQWFKGKQHFNFHNHTSIL